MTAQPVTSDQLSRLLSRYVLPAYGDVARKGPNETLTPLKDQGELDLVYSWPRANRAPAEMVANTAATNDGPKAPNLVRSLIFDTMLTKYRRSADEHQMLAWIRGLRADADQLNALGFSGIFDPGTKRVVTWLELRSTFMDKARRHGVNEVPDD